MITASQKDLKFWINNDYAIDVTGISYAQANALLNSHCLYTVAVVPGFYGISGALLQDEKGTLYAITSRRCVLFNLL